VTALLLALVLAQEPVLAADRYPNPHVACLCDYTQPFGAVEAEPFEDMQTPAEEAREAEAAWAINEMLADLDGLARP